MSGEVLVDVADVQLTLGGNRILDGVTFQIHNRTRPGMSTGQCVALLGPSGVGKTRLLRIVAGLDRADGGRILGRTGQPLAAGEVGVVFQNYPLLRHRRLRANLELAGEAAGLDPATARQRAASLLDRFGLADRGELFPAQLSGGQRQRAAIAQQLVRQRELILLDEPFSGLDPAALADVMRMLVEVANMDDFNTLVIVTHDIRAALAVSDLVVMLGRSPGKEGKPAGGAKVRRIYDLVERGMAWREGLEDDTDFIELEREIKAEFRTL